MTGKSDDEVERYSIDPTTGHLSTGLNSSEPVPPMESISYSVPVAVTPA